jgi:hypothetical protein
MNRPTFLVIGAPKAGTTTLHHWLGQHADVLMSEPKEPHFFDAHYDRGLPTYWEVHFAPYWRGQRAVGEATPTYLQFGFVAGRLARDLPDAKLIASLRNPVDRAYAAWWTFCTAGTEKRSFERAILDELQEMRAGLGYDPPDGERLLLARERVVATDRVVRGTSYLSGGHYAEHVRRYAALFPAGRTTVVLFEDLTRDPEGTTRRLWAFLGVNATTSLPDPVPRNVALGRLAARVYATPTLRAVVTRVPRRVRGVARSWLTRISPRPGMNPDTRQLLVEYYRARNRELEPLLGRDLSHWDV